MSVGDFLDIHPKQLIFPFELNKELTCSLQLTNKTQKYVAYKVLTTKPKKYTVRPFVKVIPPGTTCQVTVKMQAPIEVPLDMKCNDKFLLRSVIVPDGMTTEDITSKMFDFDKENGKVVEEFKVQVAFEGFEYVREEANGSSELAKRLLSYLENDKPKSFSHDELMSFTSNFAPENKIGVGGFGIVYKGQFLNGVQIAVKVLAENDVVEETFMAEVSTMGKVYHRNIVKLYGYCFENDMKALVFEYMENGSLDNVLYKNHFSIEWENLYGIAVDTGKALSYLHDGCSEQIIHYDVKAANVLLDSNYFPKLTDFGIAKFMSRYVTHVTLTGIRGTCGYTAPEVVMPFAPVTYKCDVYSFGMMLFEVLGRTNNQNTIEWFPKQVWDKFENGQLPELIKECNITEKDRENAEILSMVALWCVQFSPRRRPPMSTVVKMLEKEIPVGKPPNPFPL